MCNTEIFSTLGKTKKCPVITGAKLRFSARTCPAFARSLALQVRLPQEDRKEGKSGTWKLIGIQYPLRSVGIISPVGAVINCCEQKASRHHLISSGGHTNKQSGHGVPAAIDALAYGSEASGDCSQLEPNEEIWLN